MALPGESITPAPAVRTARMDAGRMPQLSIEWAGAQRD